MDTQQRYGNALQADGSDDRAQGDAEATKPDGPSEALNACPYKEKGTNAVKRVGLSWGDFWEFIGVICLMGFAGIMGHVGPAQIDLEDPGLRYLGFFLFVAGLLLWYGGLSMIKTYHYKAGRQAGIEEDEELRRENALRRGSGLKRMTPEEEQEWRENERFFDELRR